MMCPRSRPGQRITRRGRQLVCVFEPSLYAIWMLFVSIASVAEGPDQVRPSEATVSAQERPSEDTVSALVEGRLMNMEASISRLEQLIVHSTRPPPLPMSPPSPAASRAAPVPETGIMAQLKMMKEMMTLIAPPASTPVAQPTTPSPVHTPTDRQPVFSLETMERIAKMFHG